MIALTPSNSLLKINIKNIQQKLILAIGISILITWVILRTCTGINKIKSEETSSLWYPHLGKGGRLGWAKEEDDIQRQAQHPVCMVMAVYKERR